MSGELTLRLGLAEGRNANAAVAAEALLAWVALVQESARAIDANDNIVVELTGVSEGSLKFHSVLKTLDKALADIREGASDYPNLKAAAIALSLHTGIAIVQSSVTKAMSDPVQKVELSDSDRRLLIDWRDKAAASVGVQQNSRRLLETVERDPAVTEITVIDARGTTIIEIPRSEFPERTGLWEISDAPPAERTVRDVWDAVLLKAAFTPKRRRWTFLRDGLPFSALMDDAMFL
jgi:hypothetical protein